MTTIFFQFTKVPLFFRAKAPFFDSKPPNKKEAKRGRAPLFCLAGKGPLSPGYAAFSAPLFTASASASMWSAKMA